jgi:DNA-binding NarL/FixJ family response regulator
VEDDHGTRAAIEAVLRREADLNIAGTYARGDHAIPCIVHDRPDVVLMDINLPGKSGIECVATLKETLPRTQFIMLTTYNDNKLIFESLKAGASGYLLKRSQGDDLVRAIREVHGGGAPMSMPIARKIVSFFQEQKVPQGEMATLTPRELEILRHLAKGLSYKGIAEKLGIGTGTVRSHLHVVYDKLHVRSKTEAVLKYLGR